MPTKTAATVETSLTAMRHEYAERRAHAAYDNCTRVQFDEAVRALLPENEDATPAQWLAATDAVRFPCRRCAGTGSFITGTLNGVPTGPGGPCFRCEGRGTQGWASGRRNAYYDRRAFEKAARAMMHE